MALCNVDIHTASRRRFVLTVDSDPADLSYTSTLLTRLQYTVSPARTAREALDIASIITPILIITTQNLDDMPGRELIGKLKRIDSTRSVSIIVLIRKTDPSDERACLAAGAVTCLPMHVQIEDLYRVIQMAIEPVPRMNLRIETKLPVTINNCAAACDEGGYTKDLSEHGAYVRTSKPYPLKTRLPVQIHLADTALSVEAEVIYIRKPDNEHKRLLGMGLQFVQISPQDRLRIRQFIRDEITKDMR